MRRGASLSAPATPVRRRIERWNAEAAKSVDEVDSLAVACPVHVVRIMGHVADLHAPHHAPH